MFLCGLSTAVVPLLPENNYTWLAAASGLFGLSIGANYSLAAVILVDLISLERFVNAYGLLLLFQGVANLVGPPLAGWISDMTGKSATSIESVRLVLPVIGSVRFLRYVLLHCRHLHHSLGSDPWALTGVQARAFPHVFYKRHY